MIKRRPLLSLCIPTYNRAALLEETLQSVLTQIDEDLLPLIEVVVSDNASPDITQEVIQRIIRSHPGVALCYFRQTENVGADANIYSVLRRGNGDFLLALSDDDILLNGALARLVDALRQDRDLDVVHVNSGFFATDSQVLKVIMLSLASDQVHSDPNVCLSLSGVGITFLSAFAIRRTLVAGRDYAPRIGTNILQTYLFLDALLAARRIRILAQPLIGIRENNSGGYSYFEVFVTNYLAALTYAKQSGYAGATVRVARLAHLHKCLFPFVLDAKINGRHPQIDFREGAVRMLKCYGLNPFFLFVVLPLLLLPERLLHGVRGLYRLIHKQRHTA